MALPREPGRDLSQPLQEVRYLVDVDDDGARLDRFLAERLTWRSRTGVQKLIVDGFVSVLDPGPTSVAPAHRVSLKVRSGQTVLLRVPAPIVPTTSEGEAFELPIVHEDRWLVAIDKPAPLTVHPAGRHQQNTLIHLLHHRYRRPNAPAHDVVPKLVHRLDRETSGLLLVTKDDDVRHHLGVQFEQRTVEKHYLAIVHGVVPAERGVIDAPLGPARRSAVQIRMAVVEPGTGLPSRTEYTVLERHADRTLLALHPLTGRQHQLRVHLAQLGFPIVGDKIYGSDETLFLRGLADELSEDDLRVLELDRHALHSWKLTIDHPKENRRVTYEAPMPALFRSYLDRRSERLNETDNR